MPSGKPYAVFTARVNDNASDHRFFYGRYTGSGWDVHELAKAGGFLYPARTTTPVWWRLTRAIRTDYSCRRKLIHARM